MRSVIQRRAELRPAVPDVPELPVVGGVERLMDGRDVGRPRRRVGPALVVVAQIDDRSHAVLIERGPAGCRQPVDRIGPHHSAPARHATIQRGHATELAYVVAAVPIEMAPGAELTRHSRCAPGTP